MDIDRCIAHCRPLHWAAAVPLGTKYSGASTGSTVAWRAYSAPAIVSVACSQPCSAVVPQPHAL